MSNNIKKIKVSESREIEDIKIDAGYIQENFAFTLEFEFPEYLEEYNKTIEFQYNDEKVYDALINNKYELKNNITGNPYVISQIVFTKAKNEEQVQVYKTNEFHLYFSESINASTEISDESELQLMLDKVVEQINEAKETIVDYAVEETTEKAEQIIDEYTETKKEELDEETQDLKEELKQQASLITFATFEVDTVTGELVMNNADIFGNLGFTVNDITGNLEVEVYG